MHPSSISEIFWGAAVAGETLLVLILLARRSYRTFPVFFSWAAFTLVLEPTFYWLMGHTSESTYSRIFFALNFPQYLLEAGVLMEIAVNVINPAKRSLLRGMLFGFAGAMFLIVIAGFLVSAHANDATLHHTRSVVVINTTMAILRLVTFLLIAGSSQLLGLNWKNHVLQLASGLAFYAVVSLIVEIGHSHLRGGPTYNDSYIALDQLRMGGYLCTLYFWCYAFAKKEAPRKEFSPQMTKILVSLSGSTKRQRAVLARTRDQ